MARRCRCRLQCTGARPHPGRTRASRREGTPTGPVLHVAGLRRHLPSSQVVMASQDAACKHSKRRRRSETQLGARMPPGAAMGMLQPPAPA